MKIKWALRPSWVTTRGITAPMLHLRVKQLNPKLHQRTVSQHSIGRTIQCFLVQKPCNDTPSNRSHASAVYSHSANTLPVQCPPVQCGYNPPKAKEDCYWFCNFGFARHNTTSWALLLARKQKSRILQLVQEHVGWTADSSSQSSEPIFCIFHHKHCIL